MNDAIKASLTLGGIAVVVGGLATLVTTPELVKPGEAVRFQRAFSGEIGYASAGERLPRFASIDLQFDTNQRTLGVLECTGTLNGTGMPVEVRGQFVYNLPTDSGELEVLLNQYTNGPEGLDANILQSTVPVWKQFTRENLENPTLVGSEQYTSKFETIVSERYALNGTFTVTNYELMAEGNDCSPAWDGSSSTVDRYARTQAVMLGTSFEEARTNLLELAATDRDFQMELERSRQRVLVPGSNGNIIMPQEESSAQ